MIDLLVHLILFGLFMLGWWFLTQPLFMPALDRMQLRAKTSMMREVGDSSKLIQDIADFLELSINKNKLKDVYTFIFILLLTWFLVFIGLLTTGFNFFYSVLWALAIPFVIIVFLNFKAYTNRVAISFEGLDFVNELVNNYRIHYHNLAESIDETINSLGDKAPRTRKMLLNMSYRIRDAQNEKDIQKAIDQMIFIINSSWSIQLANLFKIALIKGEDITQGLLDIAKDLGQLEQMTEAKKRLNMEGSMMLKGLLPIMAITGFYFIFGISDFTLTKYLEYQLVNPIGFRLLVVTVITVLISVLLHMLFSKSKNDF